MFSHFKHVDSGGEHKLSDLNIILANGGVVKRSHEIPEINLLNEYMPIYKNVMFFNTFLH